MFQKVISEKFFQLNFTSISIHSLITESCKMCDSLNMNIQCSEPNETDNLKVQLERKAECTREAMKQDALSSSMTLLKMLATPFCQQGWYTIKGSWGHTTLFRGAQPEDKKDMHYAWDESIAYFGLFWWNWIMHRPYLN